MASKSPGRKRDNSETRRNVAGSLSRAASRLGSLFSGSSSSAAGSRRTRKKSKDRKDGDKQEEVSPSTTRLEVAYYGKRTDARDRSSEDPRRHAIPRATLTPSPPPRGDLESSSDDTRRKSKLRKKSLEREMGRRVSREREWEREIRLRERSRSRERLTGLTSTGASIAKDQILTSSTPQDLLQKQLFHSVTESSTKLTRSSSSAGPTTKQTNLAQRQASFKVERNIQLSNNDKMPPIPPPRIHRSQTQRATTSTTTPRVTEMSFEVKKPTAVDEIDASRQKTPYQSWREERKKTEELAEKVRSSSGAISKTTPRTPAESADDILSRWKQERAKRNRNVSGNSSEASSTTAEPRVKKSSLQAVFNTFSRKKSGETSNEDESKKKYSITALMTGSALNPEVHDAIIKPATNGKSEQNGQPIMGTILHPHPPKSAAQQSNSSPRTTPFEEWRQYRALRHSQGGSSTPIRARTPDPDYDALSLASSTGSGGQFTRLSVPSSHEDIHRQVGPHLYGGSSNRSSSAMGIPRFIHRPPRPPSLMSASPRLEHPSRRSSDQLYFFGRHGAHLASYESQVWYQNYSQESFPHEAEFDEKIKVGNYDGRIHSIRGRLKNITLLGSAHENVGAAFA